MHLLQRVARGFTFDKYLGAYVAHHNATVGEKVGWGLAILELVLIGGALGRSSHLNVPKLVAYCIMGVMSVALALLSRRQLKAEGANRTFVVYLVCYMCMAAVYGISNSLQDFADGKQIITFFMVMMMNSCVFAAPPMGVACLVVTSYVAMCALGFSGGRIDTGSLVNFVISGVVVAVAGFVRYHECYIGAENERKLRDSGLHDGLTGLKNRLALRKDFPSLIHRNQYVVMADLDDVKVVNDSYGHEAGDIVLTSYANALRACFPQSEIYRYGGDEFLFFASEHETKDFDGSMCELRKRMGEVEIGDGRTIAVGTSFGYVYESASSIDELREQVRKADEHLDEMKRFKKAGRG